MNARKKRHVRFWARKDRNNREELHRAKRRDRLDALMVVATILSSIATTAAVVVAIYQYSVARDQLVAADRNRTIQTMADHARVLCAMLGEVSIGESILTTHERPGPETFLDKEKTDAYIASVVLNVTNAKMEGRLYYDAQKVRERQVDDEFRVAYAKAYSDFRSAAQTVRLWIDDDDATSLQRLTESSYGFLDPRSALPNESSDETSETTKLASVLFSKLQEIQFDTFQAAHGICQSLETRIIDWAKGKRFKPYSFNILPVLTEEEAEKKFNELGKLPSVHFVEPSEKDI